MLIDMFLPRYQVAKKYSVMIDAPPPVVADNTFKVNMGRSAVIRFLFRLRGMPASAFSMDGLQSMRFTLLEVEENREIVWGLIGRFWTAGGGLLETNRDHFIGFSQGGYAKTAWNFFLEPVGKEQTRLTTETRVYATNARARRMFRIYWFFIGPFSGWIRREMLRLIKEASESKVKAPGA